MGAKMSKQARLELAAITQAEYQKANSVQKRKLLDVFTSVTGFHRKHAIRVLNADRLQVTRKRQRKPIYDEPVLEALKAVWLASNQIASKRLQPFMRTMVQKLEEYGHIVLSKEVKEKLLSMSAATIDRLLASEKKKLQRSRSTTKPGSLLKKKIEVRSFADWNDAEPGFFEADLVAHSGGIQSGTFLYTLTMTDISTGWTELQPIMGKSEEAVLRSIRKVAATLPFPFKGLDTDNGTEFLNYATIHWCEREKITFTRSREYKKNDQAHVEEKNGSVVRRLVGYDRLDSNISFEHLSDLYKLARLYINFFQPSVKLRLKEREGARVHKTYDSARTPFERLACSASISGPCKQQLQALFESLDPLALLRQIH